MKHRMDCVMTDRHPLMHPRVWQPWYIGGDERTKSAVTSPSPVALSGSSPPPDTKDSLSPPSLLLSASARRHKLKRHLERRDLENYAAACRERAKRNNIPSEELNSIGGSKSEEDDTTAAVGDCDDIDEHDSLDDDDDDSATEMDVSSTDAELARMRRERRRLIHHQNRFLLLRAAAVASHQRPPSPHLTDHVDDDAPLDMTTTKRRPVHHSTSSPSPSPSPPSSHVPYPASAPPPPFPASSAPTLLYGHHFNGPVQQQQPPPPYYQLPPSMYHHAAHRVRRVVSPPSGSPPPYVPPPPFSASLNGGHSVGAVPQQLSRPSVITCAPAASKSSSAVAAVAPMSAHRSGSRTHHPASLNASVRGGSSGSAVVPCTNGVTKLNLGGSSSSVNCNGVATGRRSLSDPTPVPSFVVGASAGGLSAGAHHGGKAGRRGSDAKQGHRREVLSVGMCDPVIDEHFRRSLGKDYPEFLSAAEKTSKATTSTPTSISITGMSVDDHFAKALGDTWLRLQGKISSSPAASNGAATPVPTVTTTSTVAASPPSPLRSSSGSCSPTDNNNSNGSSAASLEARSASTPIAIKAALSSPDATRSSLSPPASSSVTGTVVVPT